MTRARLDVPTRRPIIVLAALVGALTVSSGLLLILEPGPMPPPAKLIRLGGVKASRNTGDAWLIGAAAAPRSWQAIVIYDSGSTHDTTRSIAARHVAQGLGGMGYHFVIDRATDDQAIHVGYRWRQQLDGAVATGRDFDWYDRHSIGICLVGDSELQPPTTSQMRILIELVHQLQRRHRIAPHLVRLQGDTDADARIGRHFPLGLLRERILQPLQ